MILENLRNVAIIAHVDHGKVLSLRPFGAPPSQREARTRR